MLTWNARYGDTEILVEFKGCEGRNSVGAKNQSQLFEKLVTVKLSAEKITPKAQYNLSKWLAARSGREVA